MSSTAKSHESGLTHSRRRKHHWLVSGALQGLRTLLVVYMALVLLMMLFENRLIFVPTRNGNFSPTDMDYEEVHFTSSDGTHLHGWYLPHPHPRAQLIFCHGNFGNLTSRNQLVQFLRKKFDVSVFVFDYRGYGQSEGSPHEEGVLEDGRAAQAWLADRAGIHQHDVVLMGRSLGGAVAVRLAADNGARGLVLESVSTSFPDVGARLYPWLPVRWLMRTQFNSLDVIGRYSGPLLQSHGDRDEVIPYALGRRLHEEANEPKHFITIPGGTHNSPQSAEFWEALDKFLDRL